MARILILMIVLSAAGVSAADLSSWNGVAVSGLATINGIVPATWNGLTISTYVPVAGDRRLLQDASTYRTTEGGIIRQLEVDTSQPKRLLQDSTERLMEDNSYRLLQQ